MMSIKKAFVKKVWGAFDVLQVAKNVWLSTAYEVQAGAGQTGCLSPFVDKIRASTGQEGV
jgi:hypothetical protein